MFKFVTLASLFLIVCVSTMSTGAPVTQDENGDYGSQLSPSELNELHIWDSKPITDAGDIPPFQPAPGGTNNCPSCLPDALLSEHNRW